MNLNARIFYGGGRKIIPLLRDTQVNLAVDPANNKYWDYQKDYENRIEDTYQIIVSASYKWNKARSTHEIFINLDNITNNKGKVSEYYDESQPSSIGYVTRFLPEERGRGEGIGTEENIVLGFNADTQIN